MSFNVTAFMCVYNEADILPWTLRHLGDQGVRVHVIDNWSSDGSGDIARSFPHVSYERFPADGPSQYYSWKLLLQRVEDLALASGADWCIHHDADEIRRSDVPGESMTDAFARIHAAARGSYTAVNHEVFHFWPVDDGWDSEKDDPETYFKYCSGNDVIRQIKAWRNTGVRVDLAGSGGHAVKFPGVNVYPHRFLMKHYPTRTAEQAERKVLRERTARYDPAELAIGFHVQYRELAKTQEWIRDPATLTLWQDHRAA